MTFSESSAKKWRTYFSRRQFQKEKIICIVVIIGWPTKTKESHSRLNVIIVIIAAYHAFYINWHEDSRTSHSSQLQNSHQGARKFVLSALSRWLWLSSSCWVFELLSRRCRRRCCLYALLTPFELIREGKKWRKHVTQGLAWTGTLGRGEEMSLLMTSRAMFLS